MSASTSAIGMPPELPGGTDLFGYLGSNALSAQVVLCEIDQAIADGLCARYATSKTLALSRPAP